MKSSLKDLFVLELTDLHDAEDQIVKALPKMIKASSSEELQSAFEEHLEKTKEHASRIERVLRDMGESLKQSKCKGMQGIIAEGAELIRKKLGGHVQDAALIGAAQRVEHYEIAAYGCVRSYAELLDNQDAVDALEETLQDEKDADQKLTEIAQQVNEAAATGEEMEEEEEQPKPKAKAKGAGS